MQSKEITQKFLVFYEKLDHKQVPNVSLLPEGDSTLLFVNSGMFPLVPFLSGEEHPLGKRLVNVQRAVRFEDIEEVGDHIHTVAFHMIGNWSLGDYFKNEQLPWAYEFLIDELGLDPKRIFASVFEGDANAPKDTESIEIIKSIFSRYGIDAKLGERIFMYGKEENWWQRGDAVGELGGPDSEVFYYIGSGDPPLGKSPAHFDEDFVEIGNSVFMQYERTDNGWKELPQKNVDFGGGLERLALAAQNKSDIFETDNFWPIIERIQSLTSKQYNSDPKTKRGMRILADHMRSAVFLAMDGVVPDNKEQGYILRRLLRRMVRVAKSLDFPEDISVNLVDTVVDSFEWIYPDLKDKQDYITKLFSEEEKKFKKTLERGSKELEKIFADGLSGSTYELAERAFELYQSLGFPSEIFVEELKDRAIVFEEDSFNGIFNDIFEKHQQKSRTGAEKKFKGGLADHGETVVKYHTATHLLQQALRNVLGTDVHQVGSNITNERLRFDFTYKHKLSESQIDWVEEIVNQAVQEGMPVNFVVLPKEDAFKTGALHLENENYPEKVKVYFVGASLEDAFSKEFCGGPHVSNTSELKDIRIYKQESIGEGKIRIYAQFEG